MTVAFGDMACAGRLPTATEGVNQAGDGYRRFDCGVSEIEQGEVREPHGVQTLGSEPQITADSRLEFKV